MESQWCNEIKNERAKVTPLSQYGIWGYPHYPIFMAGLVEICLTFILVVVALSASNILLLLVKLSKISKILNFGEV